MKPAEVHEPYHASLMDHALGHEAFTGPEGFLRRRSVQVQCFSLCVCCSSVWQLNAEHRGTWTFMEEDCRVPCLAFGLSGKPATYI